MSVVVWLRSKIRENVEPVGDCWLWQASFSGTGYGDFRGNGEHWTAHRAAYTAFIGPIPPKMHVLHRCDNRACCNPEHLFIGTNQDNIRDSSLKGRRKGVRRNRPAGLVYERAEMVCQVCAAVSLRGPNALYCEKCSYALKLERNRERAAKRAGR